VSASAFRLRAFLTQLLVAALFYGLAQVSLLLGVGAVLKRPMWLPAALLAASVFSRGRKDMLGLAIGTATFGYFLYPNSRYQEAVACINALTICVQVYFGAYAAKHWLSDRGSELWRAQDLLRSALIFGPVLMFFKPMIVIPNLIWMGLVPSSNLWDRSFDWVLADVMAAYLAGPLLLLFIGQPRAWWRSRRNFLLLSQSLILLGFVAALQTTSGIEERRLRNFVHSELENRVELLNGQISLIAEIGATPERLTRLPLRKISPVQSEEVAIRALPGWALDSEKWRASEADFFAARRWQFTLTNKPALTTASGVLQEQINLPFAHPGQNQFATLTLDPLRVRQIVSGALWRLQLSFSLAAVLASVIALIVSAKQKLLAELVQQRTHSLEQASNELRLFKAIADQSTEPVVVAAPQLTASGVPQLRYANNAFLRVTQLTEAEALGQGIAVMRGANTDPERMQKLMQKLHAGKSVSDEFFHYRKDGTAYVAVLSAFPIFGANGEITHWAGLYRDISEERAKQEQERDQQRKNQERERYEQMGRMAGGVAHDFNNLLMAIQSSVELIRMEAADASMADSSTLPRALPFADTELLDGIEQAVQSGTNLTQYLLAFSGRGQGRVEWIDPAERLRAMEKMLAISVPQSVRLHFEIEQGHYCVRMDSAAWVQVVMNLVINAAQAMRAGAGEVHVKLRAPRQMQPPPAAQINAVAAEGATDVRYAELIVQDNGCGIAPELMDRIFEPFFSTKDGGTGLGMDAIARTVRQLHGWMHIHSDTSAGANTGTSVHFAFPADDSPHAAHTAGPVPAATLIVAPAARTGGHRVLVVDDETAVRAYAVSVLEGAGYVVSQAQDGQQAQLALAAQAFDLVLTDLTMPNVTGAELIAWLDRRESTPPVIVMTGFSIDRNQLLENYQHVICAWMEKPFGAPALVKHVHDAIQKFGQSRRDPAR
jgi:PAS domain S-box-containing protein